METPVPQDHSKESMHLISMQTIEILNWQLSLLCVEDLIGYVTELRLVMIYHSDYFAALCILLLTKEEQQNELVTQLDQFASIVSRKDSTRELLKTLSDLDRTMRHQQ